MTLLLSTLALAMGTQQPVIELTVDMDNPQQQIEGFGASDCWTMQWMGQWSDPEREQAAKWLFSSETDDNGQPEGIGLSIWRFNVGAGSQEQGDDSQIGTLWNRAESFLTADGSAYDFSKCKGQRWFLQQAKEYGVPVFLAFLNSPPVQMTQNGLATNTGRDGTLNLRSDCYDDFARYLADVVEGVAKNEGIMFDYLCPFNEPDGHWNWLGPKQEGTPAENVEIARAVRIIGPEFQRRGLPTQIVVSESSDYRCMYGTHETGPERGYQIQQFFTPDSVDTYIGDVPNLAPFMAGHSYWTNTPMRDLREIRSTLRDTIESRGIKFWQTELCIMGNDDELNGGGGFDPTMKTALYVMRTLHHDLVYANACSWSWWRAAGGDYKDGLLYYRANKDLLDGKVYDSKLMWALGNYSLFVRPGAERLPVKANSWRMRNATDPVGLMASAYRNADGGLVMVIINYADEDLPFTADFGSEQLMHPYLTSKGDANLKPLAPVSTSSPITIPSRSIMTLTTKPIGK